MYDSGDREEHDVLPLPTTARSRPLKIILGPGRCRGCGEEVWWGSANTRLNYRNFVARCWRNADGKRHLCPIPTDSHPDASPGPAPER